MAHVREYTCEHSHALSTTYHMHVLLLNNSLLSSGVQRVAQAILVVFTTSKAIRRNCLPRLAFHFIPHWKALFWRLGEFFFLYVERKLILSSLQNESSEPLNKIVCLAGKVDFLRYLPILKIGWKQINKYGCIKTRLIVGAGREKNVTLAFMIAPNVTRFCLYFLAFRVLKTAKKLLMKLLESMKTLKVPSSSLLSGTLLISLLHKLKLMIIATFILSFFPWTLFLFKRGVSLYTDREEQSKNCRLLQQLLHIVLCTKLHWIDWICVICILSTVAVRMCMASCSLRFL